MKSGKQSVPLAATVLLGVLAASPAQADAVAAAVRSENWTFNSTMLVAVPGMHSTPFSHIRGQRILATFSAECAVAAPTGNTSAWLDIDIVVLDSTGTVVLTLPPTELGGGGFCSSNGIAGFDQWQTNAITAFGGAPLPSGIYRVAVRARLNGGANGGWLGERSLVVWR